jgi:hypothetical protein
MASVSGRLWDVDRSAVHPHQCLLVPFNAFLLVCVRVCVSLDLSCLTTKKAVKRRADLVALALLQGVALCASCLSIVSAGGVGFGGGNEQRFWRMRGGSAGDGLDIP